MDYNYSLRYRTFDQLIADASMDLKTFDLAGKINPAELAKVAMRINYDLGLRVARTGEQVLEIEHYKAKLPIDFYIMNFALVCGNHTTEEILPQGTNIQQVDASSPLFPTYKTFGTPINACDTAEQCRPSVCLNQCGNEFKIIQIVNTQRVTYSFSAEVRFTNSKFIDCDCPNLSNNWNRWSRNNTCDREAYIKDGFVFTNFECGKMYINYQGQMMDTNGDLLVVDHPMINEYYEYAIKQRILENLMMAGENVTAQIQLIEQRIRVARNYAFTIVNTPNFSEMFKLWITNRKAQYSKYYDAFKSFPGHMDSKINNAV